MANSNIDIQWIDISKVEPSPRNRNKHSKEQIDRLSKLIKYQGFRQPLIVCKDTNELIVGHARLDAAKKLKLTKIPVSYQKFDDDVMRYAFMTSDNAIALWAELDMSGINADTLELGPFDTELLGIQNWESIAEDKDFAAGSLEDQGQLDQKQPLFCQCPKCGEMFNAYEHKSKD